MVSSRVVERMLHTSVLARLGQAVMVMSAGARGPRTVRIKDARESIRLSSKEERHSFPRRSGCFGNYGAGSRPPQGFTQLNGYVISPET